MRGVSLDLGRSPFVALDDQAVGAPAERHGRRVVAGDPGDDLLGSGDIGNNLFDGAPAPREPRERQRGAQEHHHLAPGDPLGKLRGSLRELPLEKGAGFGALLELRETSPIGPCHRWHPEQSVGGLTGRSRSSCAASVADVPGRGPLHVGDLRDGTSVGTGVAVAVEAPAHAEGRHLGDRFHLVDAAVAGDTADSCRHVRVVGEVGVVGKLVDANPAHRPAAGGAVPNRCELLAVLLHESDGSSCRSGWAERSRRQKSRPRRDSTGNRDQARRRGACGCTGRAERDGSPRLCTTGKRSTRRPRSRGSDRGCPRWRPRSGACSTKGERSGPMARIPGRRRTVAQAASPEWNDATSSFTARGAPPPLAHASRLHARRGPRAPLPEELVDRPECRYRSRNLIHELGPGSSAPGQHRANASVFRDDGSIRTPSVTA